MSTMNPEYWRERAASGDPEAAGDITRDLALSGPYGWVGRDIFGIKGGKEAQAQRLTEQQLAEGGAQASFLRGTQQDLVNQLLRQDPTASRGFQQALAQSQGAVGRSLGASGLGDSPFAAALQGQAAGSLAADFEQRRMQQLFQALGLNPGLAASPELSAQILKMLSEDPNMLAEIVKTLGPVALATL